MGVALYGWRWSDSKADESVWEQLAGTEQPSGVYETALTSQLPEPAQRYFNYTIQPGTPLLTIVEIKMNGELGLGTRDNPDYSPMQAHQILAPPHGLVWRLKSGAISGSDAATPDTSWTRFWLFNLIPVVRVGGDTDHHRSAFGRVVSEAAFWTPASLLPSSRVRWEPLDEDSARAVVFYGDYRQAVDITVAEDGQPTRVVIQRWSNENDDRKYQEQPFGGYVSDFREFNGYKLPTKVEGGNHFGTGEYFPFYKAHVTDIQWRSGDH